MLTIGPHLSIADGFEAMEEHALALGANTLAFFTRNPRGGKAKAIDEGDVQAFLALGREHAFGKLVAHAAYTLNPATKTEALRAFARDTFADDLRRMEHLPGNYYNLHPGSHVGQGVEVGIGHIADMLAGAMTEAQTTVVLLETMAGKGSEIGGTFEELREILDRAPHADRVGVCLDTCHVWDGGYDIAGDLDGVLTAFDRVIGLHRLKAVHLNDSMNPCGAKKDRHAEIGMGQIGEAAFGRIINHPALRTLPFILETPGGDAGWRREIALLRSLYRA